MNKDKVTQADMNTALEAFNVKLDKEIRITASRMLYGAWALAIGMQAELDLDEAKEKAEAYLIAHVYKNEKEKDATRKASKTVANSLCLVPFAMEKLLEQLEQDKGLAVTRCTPPTKKEAEREIAASDCAGPLEATKVGWTAMKEETRDDILEELKQEKHESDPTTVPVIEDAAIERRLSFRATQGKKSGEAKTRASRITETIKQDFDSFAQALISLDNDSFQLVLNEVLRQSRTIPRAGMTEQI